MTVTLKVSPDAESRSDAGAEDIAARGRFLREIRSPRHWKLPGNLFLALLLSVVLCGAGLASPPGVPAVGKPIPALALPDIAGRTHRLSDLKQDPRTLVFVCGCTPCHEFARLWSQVQQSGELRTGALAPTLPVQKPNPATVVVFLGDAPTARTFAAQTGLDLSQTLLLTDPMDQMGQKFGVILCPRVFVLDAAQRLVYTNADIPAPRLSATALVSRTLTAWRHRPARKSPARK